MVKGKTKIVPHRRRRSLKTDYKGRLRLLKSKKPRLVMRKSLNNVSCQIIEYSPEGDRCLVSANSSELRGFGWKGGMGNIPSAYLTGLLCGMKAKEKKIEGAVFDMGMYTSTSGSRLYAALKGALDAGLDIPHSSEILPDEKRTAGSHIAAYAERLNKENPNGYKKSFSVYLKNKISPESLPKHFEEVKQKISKGKSKAAKSQKT